MKNGLIAINTIALLCLLFAVGLMVFLFAESRNDPSLRIAALVAGTGLVASLAAIASTILTGKDLTRHDTDLPPNSTATTNSTVQVGPQAPPAPAPIVSVQAPLVSVTPPKEQE